jgi:hypothetical protein
MCGRGSYRALRCGGGGGGGPRGKGDGRRRICGVPLVDPNADGGREYVGFIVCFGRRGMGGGAETVASCIVGRSVAEAGSGVTETDRVFRFGEAEVRTSRTG